MYTLPLWHHFHASKQSMISLHSPQHFMASLSDLAAAFAVAVISIMLAGESTARELRPSYHGLVFQNSPPSGVHYPPQMMSFFNGKNSSPESSSSSGLALPKAMNSSNSSPSAWWRATTGPGGRDHVREALMVASLVCGITGVVLLLASGLLYVFKYRKHKLDEPSRDHNEIENNKLELVVRHP